MDVGCSLCDNPFQRRKDGKGWDKRRLKDKRRQKTDLRTPPGSERCMLGNQQPVAAMTDDLCTALYKFDVLPYKDVTG